MRSNKYGFRLFFSFLTVGIMFFIVPVYAGGVRLADRHELIVKLQGHERLLKFDFASDDDMRSAQDMYRGYSVVEYSEPNSLYHIALEPFDTFYTQQIYLTQIQANRAWNEIHDSPDVVIAVLDTGVDINHIDLRNNIWINANEIPGNGIDDDGNGFIDDVNGWDFVNDTSDPSPKFDSDDYTRTAMHHGTVVAGIAAGEGGNNVGIAGVTWNVQIMPLRVLDSTGTGDTLTVSRAINYARENGADIINLSFVGGDSSQSLRLALERAYHAGMFIIAASGNEVSQGIDMDIDPRYPVCEDGPRNENWIIGVNAVDGNDRKASFSNYGVDCIDVSAPGVRLFSTQFTTNERVGFDDEYGGGWTGTSVATPQVAGLAALIKQQNPGILLREWQRLVLDNVDSINRVNLEWQGKLGTGRINVFNAVLTGGRYSVSSGQRRFIATGAGPGGGPHIRVFDFGSNVVRQFFAYESDFSGGTQVVIADVIGDDTYELIVTPYEGRAPTVSVFDSFGRLKYDFLAYDADFYGGLTLATGDVDNDGFTDIVTAPRESGGPHIRIFNAQGNLKNEFFAYHPTFRGGVNVAVEDVDNDGVDEIITAPASRSLPLVRVYAYDGTLESEFFAFDPDYINGMSLAVSGRFIVVGAGNGSAPRVRVFDTVGNLQREWLAYSSNFLGGVRVQIADVNGDNLPEVVTGADVGGGPHLRIFDIFGTLIKQWMVYNPHFRGGISISVED